MSSVFKSSPDFLFFTSFYFLPSFPLFFFFFFKGRIVCGVIGTGSMGNLSTPKLIPRTTVCGSVRPSAGS